MLLGIVYHCFLFLGAGTALYYLFGQFGGDWGIFMWAVVVLGAVVFMASRPNEYKWLEVVANCAMATLVVIFLWALIGSGIDLGAFINGLTFSMPEDRGAYGAWLVVVAIIGAVGGSVANLMYPYFVVDKGWRGPKYRKLQVYDLLFGVSTLIVLNIAIWIVAAEIMRGRGATIEGAGGPRADDGAGDRPGRPDAAVDRGVLRRLRQHRHAGLRVPAHRRGGRAQDLPEAGRAVRVARAPPATRTRRTGAGRRPTRRATSTEDPPRPLRRPHARPDVPLDPGRCC